MAHRLNNMKTILVIFAAFLPLLAETGYKVVSRHPIPGNGGFDYVTFDPDTRHIYFSHATQV